METGITKEPTDVASRIAQRTLAKRSANYANEVRRLLDAALKVMLEFGTSARPRVADIVAAAGLSNDAFYRHFPSKDALIAALVQDGSERIASYAAHQMGKETAPERKVRRWVEAVLAQTRQDKASITLAVMWHGTDMGDDLAPTRHTAISVISVLLREPFAAMGSTAPAADAALAAHAVFGRITDYVWQRVTPTKAEVDHIVEFCLRAVTPAPATEAKADL